LIVAGEFGVLFNGRHSSEFGLVMLTKNRPILPEPKIITDEAPGMDGDYDYSDSNPDGRTKWKPRPHELTFEIDRRKVNCRDPRAVRAKAHEIAVWLACGEQQLIYDDDTAVFYLARVVNRLDLESQIQPNRPFTVQFKTRPYGFSRLMSSEGLKRGYGFMRGQGYRRDMAATVYQVTGPVTVNIYNPGTFVKPVLKVSGQYNYISFSCNGKTLTFGHSNHPVDIDCEKMRAIDDTGNRTRSLWDDSEFIEFINGNNALVIGGEGLNCTVTVEFRYLYL
jgi:predicted phage tail component-like protein